MARLIIWADVLVRESHLGKPARDGLKQLNCMTEITELGGDSSVDANFSHLRFGLPPVSAASAVWITGTRPL